MGTELKNRDREAKQLKSANSSEEQSKSMAPPAFQLKSSTLAQMKQDDDGVTQQMSLRDVVSGVTDWITNLFHPQEREEGGGAATTSGETEAPVVETPATEQQQEQVAEVENATETAEPEQTREEQISELLQAHYDGFAAISINIPNPVEGAEPATLPCEVRPPYMINTESRMANPTANRAANRRVNALINTFSWGFRHGKASASDIQSFLQQAVDQGLTTDNTSAGLHEFLARFGIGVDCSGFTSQGYNYLMTELGLDDEQQMSVNNTGSGSFRSSNPRFSVVSAPSDLKPGDALYLDNPRGIDHVRMVQNVTVNGTNIDFVTIESASGPDGPRQRHWRFTDPADFGSLQVSDDGGTTYTDSTENQEFARFDALYPAEETTDETTTTE